MRWAALCLLAVLITACGTAGPPAPVIMTTTSAVPSPSGVVSGPAALKGDANSNCYSRMPG